MIGLSSIRSTVIRSFVSCSPAGRSKLTIDQCHAPGRIYGMPDMVTGPPWFLRAVGTFRGSHPEWYPNLTLESSLLDFQKFLYERYPGGREKNR